jgi:hypothetical protein
MSLPYYLFGIACGSLPPLYGSWMIQETQKHSLKHLRIAGSGRLQLYDLSEPPKVPIVSRAALNLVLVNLHETLLQYRDSI